MFFKLFNSKKAIINNRMFFFQIQRGAAANLNISFCLLFYDIKMYKDTYIEVFNSFQLGLIKNFYNVTYKYLEP